MARNYFRHRLLLDEAVEVRSFFPQLNNRFDVRHLVQDLGLDGLSDSKVHELAANLNRIVITYNVKDFKPLAGTDERTGVIGITHNLSAEQLDTKLTALLMRATQKELLGKFTSLSTN